MKNSRVVSLVMCVALVAVCIVGGVFAFLTDASADVNVMTLGNVDIEQHEYERVVENGAWVSTGETDKYGYTPDKVQEFTQGKPLYPAVFKDGAIKYDDRANGAHQQSWAQVGAPGSNQLFDDSVKNVQDKFVFVENTGSSDAYVRTWFAFEQGTLDAKRLDEVIKTNGDASHWSWETVATDVEIDGNEYLVACATYSGPASNPNSILEAGKTSYASLLQVYMAPEATNEDVVALDGNENGTYDILVLSQAVQTEGFDSAKEALNSAFGGSHPWVSTNMENVGSNDGLKDALQGDEAHIIVNLTEDVTYDLAAWQNEAMGGENTEMIIINGNGHTITFNNTNSDWNNIVTNGAKLVINDAVITNAGNDATSGTWNGHDINFNCEVELNDVTLLNAISLADDATLNRVNITDDSTSDAYLIWIRPNGQTVNINGCTIDATGTDGNDRGIKIDEQYVSNPKKVTLNVKNTKFVTEKKGAILVKSVAGANINLNNVDISGVAADTVNAVWVDADSKDYAELVTVTGGTKIVEE